jgi:hypothetical protein
MPYTKQMVVALTGLWMLLGDHAPLGGEPKAADVHTPRFKQVQSRQAAPRRGRAKIVQAREFILRDQFDQTHVYRFPHPRVSVLVMADRRGSRQLEAWIQPIYARFEKRINIAGVAEMSRVPRFARGLARRFLRQRLSYPVMLDWTGEVTQRYDYQQGQANLFVIDQSGYIVLRLMGAVDPVKLQRVLTVIDRLETDTSIGLRDGTHQPAADLKNDAN